jgi:DNA polymerase I-like protein with 3'-5' exonuclease and polymerase domains
VLPSQLLQLALRGTLPSGPVALDTETSGLFVDDGARVAVVSVAWIDRGESWRGLFGPFLGLRDTSVASWGFERVHGSESLPVASVAWAFDQGVEGTGKPEDLGNLSLWGKTQNLPESEWQALLEWLRIVGRCCGFVFHHAKFDLHLMDAGVRRWPGQGIDLSPWTVWDTQNVCHLFWPQAKTTSLKPTAQRLWGVAETNESQLVKAYLAKSKLPNGRWDLVPWETIGPYADQDARLTIRLYEHQEAEFALAKTWFDQSKGHLSLAEVIERRLATSLMLFRIERRGLPFNADLAVAQSELIAKRQEALTAKLPFKPATLPMAKHYWFGTGVKNGVAGLGLAPYAQTESGQPQLNAQVIDKMVADKVPAADLWRDLQKLNTVDSRWYSGWASMVGPDGRLRASVRQNGTVSSRFSVERVQLQAIPHDYRLAGYDALADIVTPRQLIGAGVPSGFELWELDLAQAELRVAALYANCTRMLALINEGQDLHGEAATQLFKVTPDSPDWGKMRNVAKRANFSLIFGVGAEKLQADIETQTGVVLTLDEARRLVRDWNALFPEFQQAIKHHMEAVEDRRRSGAFWGLGWVATANGERRWFQPDEDTHKAFNQRVQPNLAQFGLNWWLDVEATITAELGDGVEVDPGSLEPIGRVGVVMLIHDSMVLLLPEDGGQAIAEAAVARGRELWSKFFPGVPGDVDMKRWGK